MAPDISGSDLAKLAQKLLAEGPHKTMPTSRRVRIRLGGLDVVDTTHAVFVWEHPYYPHLYAPQREFVQDAERLSWKAVEEVSDGSGKTGAKVVSLDVGGKKTDRVIAFESGPLEGLVRVEVASVDGFFEEDYPIKGHPRDPFKRVDTLPSSRRIVVKLAGVTLADAAFSIHLLETMLPTRYYLPIPAITPGILRPSDKRTWCPYKGEAEYYDVVLDGKVHKDLVWYYIAPNPECAKIQGLACFYNEKVEVWVGGVKEEQPKTHF